MSLVTFSGNCSFFVLATRCARSQGRHAHCGTARFASRLIGDREVIRPHETRSRRPGELFSTRGYSDQHVTEAAVLPSEIEQLPDLAGYLKLAARPQWRRVRLSPT